MKFQKTIRTVLGAAVCAGILACLAGCSVSFCGVRPGGTKELVFSCGEALPEKEEESAPTASDPHAVSEQAEEKEEMSDPSAAGREASGDTGTSGGGAAAADGRVDLNSAGLEELMTLNGIGETRAKAILEYREQNGPFTKEEDIMQVQGIKEGIYSKIQNQIVVH